MASTISSCLGLDSMGGNWPFFFPINKAVSLSLKFSLQNLTCLFEVRIKMKKITQPTKNNFFYQFDTESIASNESHLPPKLFLKGSLGSIPPVISMGFS
jgi:hypothetical protein